MHFKEVKSILSPKNGMNLTRGCTHGCIYCDSRSTCYQMKHDFEDIEIKTNAIELLEQTLKRKRSKCMIVTGAMSDPYTQCETELRLTRKALELIEKYGFGVSIQTKSTRILDDLELLRRINQKTKCVVQMTLTTFDETLCKIIEPNVSTTLERVNALKVLNMNQIPTIVWMTPILPFINDTEENIRGLLNYCIEAKVKGIMCFGIGVTLREGDREYFYQKLDQHFPGLKKDYQRVYGEDYVVNSPNNDYLMKIFYEECSKHGIMSNVDDIFNYIQQFDGVDPISNNQLSLF
jgi:DNA repair photolyase